jgi:hypothetical protein
MFLLWFSILFFKVVSTDKRTDMLYKDYYKDFFYSFGDFGIQSY